HRHPQPAAPRRDPRRQARRRTRAQRPVREDDRRGPRPAERPAGGGTRCRTEADGDQAAAREGTRDYALERDAVLASGPQALSAPSSGITILSVPTAVAPSTRAVIVTVPGDAPAPGKNVAVATPLASVTLFAAKSPTFPPNGSVEVKMTFSPW